MSEIPDEIFPEILCRLPVLPILRFRCVSKSWKGLIDSPEFVKKHLNQSQKPSSRLNLIIDSTIPYWAVLDVSCEPRSLVFKELPHPFMTPSDFEIFGSCNGLLALLLEMNGRIMLLNPFTRSFHKLPAAETEFPYKCPSTYHSDIWQPLAEYAFGYDCVSDDYKVVRRIQTLEKYSLGVVVSEVNVYSLRSNTWRRIQGFPYWSKGSAGVLANGSIHWIVTREVYNSDRLIAVFDLGTEEYRLVPFVDFAYTKFDDMLLGVLGGCLCATVSECQMKRFDIWVMKEYAVKESWTILFSIRHCELSRPYMFLRPIEYSKCGRKVLLRHDCNLLIYDLDKRSTHYPFAQLRFVEPFSITTCLQSLVMLSRHVTNKHIHDRATKRLTQKRMPWKI